MSDLRNMLKDGMIIEDYMGNSYLIVCMGTKYLDENEGVVMNISSDFDENLQDTIFGDEMLDIENIYNNDNKLIWRR